MLARCLHDERAQHSFPTRRSSDLYYDRYIEEFEGNEQNYDNTPLTKASEDVQEMQKALDDGKASLTSEGGKADRKSTRLNSSHPSISYAVFCLKKKKAHAHSARTV